MAIPELVAIAGPNGAGKSTFYETFLSEAGLVFVNADQIALASGMGPYEAANLAERIRAFLVSSKLSFVFETVFSDPQGEKVQFLADAASAGYSVILCYIGLSRPELSINRVALRVTQGGHDVTDEKLEARYPRSLANLGRAIKVLPEVRVYDNSDLRDPYRHLATFRYGKQSFGNANSPDWLSQAISLGSQD